VITIPRELGKERYSRSGGFNGCLVGEMALSLDASAGSIERLVEKFCHSEYAACIAEDANDKIPDPHDRALFGVWLMSGIGIPVQLEEEEKEEPHENEEAEESKTTWSPYGREACQPRLLAQPRS